MKKILVLAYAISPTRGSEYSVAWNYVTNMSNDNELVILYGTSGNHIGDFSELKKYLETVSVFNVRFVEVQPTKIGDFLNTLNKRNIFVYSFYFAYNLWHKQAYSVAKKLIEKERFDLIHFIVPIGYREPGYLWKLNMPYLWGPIGGMTNVPMKLMSVLPSKGKLKLGFRNIVNSFQLYFNSRVKRALDASDVILASTTENQHIIKRMFEKSSIYFPENGINGEICSNKPQRKNDERINLIWIGSIDERKALIILLKALDEMNDTRNIQLNIVGDGYLKRELQESILNKDYNQRVKWHGAVSRMKVFELLSASQLHIITSLNEANTTVIWEAMSLGVPTISLDHCGMHDVICEKCGVRIKINSFEQVVKELAEQLEFFANNPNELDLLSDGVIECAKKHTWDKRRMFFNEMYNMAINNWNNKSKNRNVKYN
jgi:glycosyltransferase involved in cell wall biosynthesis